MSFGGKKVQGESGKTSGMAWRAKSHSSRTINRRNEWFVSIFGDSIDFWQGSDESHGHLFAGQVSGSQEESTNLTSDYRAPLDFVVTDPSVLGQNKPPLTPRLGKPGFIRRALFETFIMRDDVSATGSQSPCDDMPAQGGVQKEGRTLRPLRARVRSGSLLRFPPLRDHSPPLDLRWNRLPCNGPRSRR